MSDDQESRHARCSSFQVRSLKFLVKTTLVWWAIALGLGVWQVISGLELGGVIVVVAGLGMTGALCYAIQRSVVDSAGLLLQALRARRQRDDGGRRHLAAVPELPQATQSSSPDPRR